MIEKNIETATHGRYLVESSGAGAPLLVGFHGYAESADNEFARLRSIDAAAGWTVVAVQALHRFYRGRTRDVVASWMTAQDRELAIADNIAYASKVIESVSIEWVGSPTLVVSGFSQGVAMAYRCAASLSRPVSGVIALAGDVPPELDHSRLSRIPAVLLGRGLNDEWYPADKLARDEQRLRSAGVKVEVVTFAGGHEWTAEFRNAASRFLDLVTRRK
jgi:predicted esterase